jgi:hypothetical protein
MNLSMDAFGFAENLKIGPLVDVPTGRGAGTADHDRLAACATDLDDLERVVLLRKHASRHHEVGPCEVVVGQLFGIAVDQADSPGGWQQRCHRDQAERGSGVAGTENFAGCREVPECTPGKARVDHQHVGCARRRRHR